MLPFLMWLVQGGVGPALVALPVNWASADLAREARRWFRRLRRSDGLSWIVRAAAGDVRLSDAEFEAVRRLLEDESTWVQVGRGTIEELAALIASCLPGRPGEGSLAASRAIAEGLLEFAIRDLEPEWFRQVLFARLERMQTDQASALDQAMLSVHADLVALLAHEDAADADRFARVMGELGRVLDRLPAGPADRGEIAVYLTRLINWLDTDPWPQDNRFGGSALTAAAIERKMRVTSPGKQDLDLDADDQARRCSRLVVLGGPGSGKTWLARRTVRLCAEAALEALAAGALPDEVELPLYTTCARLSAAPPGDSIRRAIASSALGQLPDLGGARVINALQVLFEERNTPTLLVADSLDEAHGADERIRQADTLPLGWRIVLTSRPGSWNRQLAIGDRDEARKVVDLQPLCYPDDVEPFIARWFSGRPAWAADIMKQLRDRPALQETATVPLILAFYCIVGGDQPLPGRRTELFARVTRRMLTGRWRGSADRDPDVDACLEILRGWAWTAAPSDPVSGVGTWPDEFPTPRVRQSQDDRDALDHVAVPLGYPDPDTGMTRRRFIHRSIREHLVAEHVATAMTAEEAAGELLNHLWYDPDWEYAGPAGLAMHPHRDQVIRALMCRITGGDQFPVNLAALDGCWEIRWFLAQVAQESTEGDWPPEEAEIIGQARQDLEMLRPDADLYIHEIAASDWPTSNGLILRSLLASLSDETEPWARWRVMEVVTRLAVMADQRPLAREAFLARLARETDPAVVPEWAEAVAELGPTPGERARAQETLLNILTRQADPYAAGSLARGMTRLDPTAAERARARETLLPLLTSEAWVPRELLKAVVRLAVTAEERAQTRKTLLRSLARDTDVETSSGLPEALAELAVTAGERAQAREALLELFINVTDPTTALGLARALAGLDPTADERARARQTLLELLAFQTDPRPAESLAEALAELQPTPEDRARVREILLELLGHETDPNMTLSLAENLARLAVTARERAQTRHTLLELLALQTVPWAAVRLAEAIAELHPAGEERPWTRDVLLKLLTPDTHPYPAEELAQKVVALAVTAEERAQTRETLLELFTSETRARKAEWLPEAVAGLAVTADERARAKEALLTVLTRADPDVAQALGAARALAALDPTADERARARQTLLKLLTHQADPDVAQALAEAVAELEPTAEERARARELLLELLPTQIESMWIWEGGLAKVVAGLAVTTEERAQTRKVLLTLLIWQTGHSVAHGLAEAVAGLPVTAEERAQTKRVLLTLLIRQTEPRVAGQLAGVVAALDPTTQQLARARRALQALLTSQTNVNGARMLANAIAELTPTVADLDGSSAWQFPPTPALMAAARRNSPLPAWIAALPLLSAAREPT
jgi:hypothetical protein